MKRTVSKRTVRVADLRGLTNTETHTECAGRVVIARAAKLRLIKFLIEFGQQRLCFGDRVPRIHRHDTEGTTARCRGSDC